MSNEVVPHQKRRQGPDIWIRIMNWIGFSSWLVLFIILYILTKAGPQVAGYFDKYFNYHPRKTWDLELASYSFYLMIFLLIFSITGFIINMKRHRRKEDKYSFSIMLMVVLSIFGMIFYLINF